MVLRYACSSLYSCESGSCGTQSLGILTQYQLDVMISPRGLKGRVGPRSYQWIASAGLGVDKVQFARGKSSVTRGVIYDAGHGSLRHTNSLEIRL